MSVRVLCEGVDVFAWALRHGDVPDGLNLLHSCDRPACCEVSHLRTGTQKENAQDCLARFRSASGAEGHSQATLTHAQAAEIHRLAHWGGITQQEIAEMFGIKQGTVSRIKNGISRNYSVNEHAKERV